MKKWLLIGLVVIVIYLLYVVTNSTYQAPKESITQHTSWVLDGKTYQFEALNNQVLVMHGPLEPPTKQNKGFMNNPALVKSQNGLVIIDPGSTEYVGKQVLKQIKYISNQPILGSFNTHIHGDHWLANDAISSAYPQQQTYGHQQMITQINEGQGKVWLAILESMTAGLSKGTQVSPPQVAVKHLDELIIDGEKFRIHSPYEKTHSQTDIMIEHTNSKTLFMGDNGLNNRLAPFRSNDASILNTIELLKYALKLDITTFVPGHGLSGNATKTVMPYLSYLKTLYKEVKKGYEEDLADYEIKPILQKQLTQYQNWHGFNDYLGLHINKMMLEIEDKDL